MPALVVTGGAGFIGSHLADALVARGDEVHRRHPRRPARREQVPDGASSTFRDSAALDDLADASDRAVFHLAAQADVRVSVEARR